MAFGTRNEHRAVNYHRDRSAFKIFTIKKKAPEVDSRGDQ